MYIFEEMKINKFHKVRIPKMAEYFGTGRFVKDNAKYGGEETALNAIGTDKISDTEALMQELDRQEKEGK